MQEYEMQCRAADSYRLLVAERMCSIPLADNVLYRQFPGHAYEVKWDVVAREHYELAREITTLEVVTNRKSMHQVQGIMIWPSVARTILDFLGCRQIPIQLQWLPVQPFPSNHVPASGMPAMLTLSDKPACDEVLERKHVPDGKIANHPHLQDPQEHLSCMPIQNADDPNFGNARQEQHAQSQEASVVIADLIQKLPYDEPLFIEELLDCCPPGMVEDDLLNLLSRRSDIFRQNEVRNLFCVFPSIQCQAWLPVSIATRGGTMT